ncbi:MAG: transposase, partial [Methanolinea sp.]|nr:transposase [Methanolinea sp.]
MIVLEGEYIFGETMNSPLIVDRKDPKWFLLEQVLSLVSSREARQVFSKNKLEPINEAVEAVKIVLVAMFFS